MFEECTTLSELNLARLSAVKENNITDVNNAYNARRTEILKQRSSYNHIDVVRVELPQVELMSFLPYLGPSSAPGVIQHTAQGFKA